MFLPRTSQFQQLHSVFEKNWCESPDISEQPVISHISESNGELNIGINHPTAIASSLVRMKQRIEDLEMLNDQLYQYLYSLVENLPDLILKTIHGDIELNQMLDFVKPSEPLKQSHECRVTDASELPLPTRREKDILDLLAKGYCAKEIAQQLFISETTVITHKKNLKKKFKVKNTAELISRVRSLV